MHDFSVLSGEVEKEIKKFSFVENSRVRSVFFLPSSICFAFLVLREEYGKLFDFVNAKKLNIKNRGFKEVMRCFHNDSSSVTHSATTSVPVIDTCCSSVCPSTPVEEGGSSSECDTHSN